MSISKEENNGDFIDKLLQDFPNRVTGFLENLQDKINNTISRRALKSCITILFIVELLFLTYSCMTCDSIAERIKEVYGCTTVGGLLNLGIDIIPFLIREFQVDFSFGNTDLMLLVENETSFLETILGNSQWLVSGVLAVLVALLCREMKHLGYSFFMRVIHSVLFTFFLGNLMLLFLNGFVWGNSGIIAWTNNLKENGHYFLFLLVTVAGIAIGVVALLLTLHELLDQLVNLFISALLVIGVGVLVLYAPQVIPVKQLIALILLFVVCIILFMINRAPNRAARIFISLLIMVGVIVFVCFGFYVIFQAPMDDAAALQQIYEYASENSDVTYAAMAVFFTIAFNIYAFTDDEVEYGI